MTKKLIIVTLFLLAGCNSEPLIYPSRLMTIIECFDAASTIPYRYERVDIWQTPQETLRLGYGDCEDKAIYLNFLLEHNGIVSNVYFGKMNVSDMGYHAWVEAVCMNQVYVADPTNFVFINKSYLRPGMYVQCDYYWYVAFKMWQYRDWSINKHYKDMFDEAIHQCQNDRGTR